MSTDTHPLTAIPLDPAFAHYVLLADRAALPAIAAWLENRPEGVQVEVYIEIDHEGERVDLPGEDEDEDLRLWWLERNGMDMAESGLLEDMLIEVELPDQDGVTCFWIATEAARAQRMADFLASDWGIAADALHVAALPA